MLNKKELEEQVAKYLETLSVTDGAEVYATYRELAREPLHDFLRWLFPEEYTCAVCEGTFEKGWSDAEALEDLKREFGDVSLTVCALVCDNCWKQIRPGTGAI